MALGEPGRRTNVRAALLQAWRKHWGAQGPELNGPFVSLQQKHLLFVALFVCLFPRAVSVLLLPQGSAWGRRLQKCWASRISKPLFIAPGPGEYLVGPRGREVFPFCRLTWEDKTSPLSEN